MFTWHKSHEKPLTGVLYFSAMACFNQDEECSSLQRWREKSFVSVLPYDVKTSKSGDALQFLLQRAMSWLLKMMNRQKRMKIAHLMLCLQAPKIIWGMVWHQVDTPKLFAIYMIPTDHMPASIITTPKTPANTFFFTKANKTQTASCPLAPGLRSREANVS